MTRLEQAVKALLPYAHGNRENPERTLAHLIRSHLCPNNAHCIDEHHSSCSKCWNQEVQE